MAHTCGAATTFNEVQKQARLARIQAWQKGKREEAGKGGATASSSAAGSANSKGGKGAKTGKRKRLLEGKRQGTGKGMKRFPSSRSVRALCRHPDVASPMGCINACAQQGTVLQRPAPLGCINACAQQGTVLQRHAPLRFLPIETRSLRASRNGFM